MVRFFVLFACSAWVSSGSVAQAQPPPVERVVSMLRAFESGPARGAWRALGPETLGVLVALYQDRTQPPYVRLRAVDAAGHFPQPACRSFLLAVARAPNQDPLLIRTAVLSLGRAFGPRAIGDLRGFLQSPSAVVREATARALARIGTPSARDLLRRQQAVDSDPQVRATIRRTLER